MQKIYISFTILFHLVALIRAWIIIIKFVSEQRIYKHVLTSMPSLFMMVASIFKIAVLMDRGGGSFVIPMLMAFDLLWFSTMISLFLFISCCFCSAENKTTVFSATENSWRANGHSRYINPQHSELLRSISGYWYRASAFFSYKTPRYTDTPTYI